MKFKKFTIGVFLAESDSKSITPATVRIAMRREIDELSDEKLALMIQNAEEVKTAKVV